MFSFFKSKPTVSLIRLNGVIGNVGRFSQGMSYASQSDIIKKAFALKNIKAVVISINSPGGSPVQSNLLYDLIRSEAEDKKVKVITYAEDVAASGGYMLMCSGDEICQVFDAEIHEAITQFAAPTEDMKGKVIDEVEKGYYLNDKVIRFAKVVVGN